MRRTSVRIILVGAASAALFGVIGVAPASANGIADIGLWSGNTDGVLCVQYGLDWYDHTVTSNPNWQSWVTVDGSYGPKTQQAVKWFQEHVNTIYPGRLSVDGIVGQNTGIFIADEDTLAATNDPGYGPAWLGNCAKLIPDALN